MDVARHGIACELGPHVAAYGVGVEPRARRGHDVGGQPLAVLRVGHARDRDLMDLREPGDDVLGRASGRRSRRRRRSSRRPGRRRTAGRRSSRWPTSPMQSMPSLRLDRQRRRCSPRSHAVARRRCGPWRPAAPGGHGRRGSRPRHAVTGRPAVSGSARRSAAVAMLTQPGLGRAVDVAQLDRERVHERGRQVTGQPGAADRGHAQGRQVVRRRASAGAARGCAAA